MQIVTLDATPAASVLAEEFVTGREFTVAVLGHGASARALPIVEIVAPEGKYDYQNKYFTDVTQYHCPSGLPEEEEREIQRMVLQAFLDDGGFGG